MRSRGFWVRAPRIYFLKPGFLAVATMALPAAAKTMVSNPLTTGFWQWLTLLQ
jgi:hypothetical protein